MGGDIVEENIDKEVIQNAQPTSLNNEKLKIKAAENVEAIKLEQEKLMAQKLEVERLEKERLDKINWLNQVLEDDPELNKAYNDISAALETFSEQIGEDGYELINRYVDELGDGKVDPTDVYKVLFIESTGRIYDKNGNLLESASHAYGPFQIKKCAEEDINKNYETNYDVKKPYDNLAVNVLLLRWLNDFRTNQMEKGKNLPTGYNLKHAIMWGYHDGAYAKNISYYGQAYINEYDRLSKLDEYPELYDLMSGKLDTPITVESLNDET